MKSIDKVVYKVVGKQTRHCTNWHIYSTRFSYHLSRKKFLRKHPFLKSFLPRYLKNTIVKMAPNSIGILTFNNPFNAATFAVKSCLENIKIIKVKGIHQLHRSKVIQSCGFDPRQLSKKDYLSCLNIQAPSGTLFFKKVKVLE